MLGSLEETKKKDVWASFFKRTYDLDGKKRVKTLKQLAKQMIPTDFCQV